MLALDFDGRLEKAARQRQVEGGTAPALNRSVISQAGAALKHWLK
jgi:hypothetical protein